MMGIISKLLKKAPKQENKISVPEISAEKQQEDLKRLLAFENKIKSTPQTLKTPADKPESTSFKIKNPFVGE